MKDFEQLKYSASKKRSKRQTSKVTGLGWILLFLTICGLGLLMLTNLFGLHSSRVAVTSYQTLTREFTTPGLIIRNEIVTFAPRQGRVNIKVSEGTRVKAGEHILTLTTGQHKDQLYNYEPGIVSYKIDGLENTLRGASRSELTYNQFKKLRGEINSIASGDKVNVGRPLFKIIDNFKFYLAVLLPQKKLSEYEAGTRVEVIFSQLKDTRSFAGQVDMIITDKPENIMIIELTKFIPQLINLRKTTVRVVKNRYHGLVVPKKALIKKKDGTTGVKIRGQTKDYFKEVEVKQEVEQKAVIKGILPGVKVLIN